jgi:hypothetical protein
MSRSDPVVVAGRELTPEEIARRSAFFDDKLRGGIEGIAQRIYELFNVKVTSKTANSSSTLTMAQRSIQRRFTGLTANRGLTHQERSKTFPRLRARRHRAP